MKKSRAQVYTLEFKKSSAKLAATANQPLTETAKELGVNKNTLAGWVKRYYPKVNIASKEVDNDFETKLKEIQKELSRVKQERDILKKAVAYFAKEI
jgi:transposase